MTEIGDTARAIRELRTARRWTQAQLASALGTDAVTISRWERGASHPRPSALWRLSSLGLERAPQSRVQFVENPVKRLRALDRMLKEQRDLQRRARPVR